MLLLLAKIFVITLGSISTAYIWYVETSRSNFQNAAQFLGLEGQKPEVLLNIFKIAGYLEKQKLWEDIHRSKIFGEEASAVFYEAHAVIQNYKDMSKISYNLFGKSIQYFWKNPSIVSSQQIQNWILYVAQNAFDRKAGQERSELNYKEWMKSSKSEEYIASAKILGLIDRIDADRTEYDEAWIAGSSRPDILARSIDYKWIINHGVKINGATKILAGSRPLWAEIDGIHPEVLRQLMEAFEKGTKIDDINVVAHAQPESERIKEGVEYITNLAQKLKISLVHNAPVIKYAQEEKCPDGLFPGRTYLNYTDPTVHKLDESVMSHDVLQLVLKDHEVELVDTKAQQHERPTTATTVSDAISYLLQDIAKDKYGDQKEFHILFETNQPYIERQTLSAQAVVNGFLPQGILVTLHGVGFGCKEDIATIHSELGALIYEKWKITSPYELSTHLCFQTRDNDAEVPILRDES